LKRGGNRRRNAERFLTNKPRFSDSAKPRLKREIGRKQERGKDGSHPLLRMTVELLRMTVELLRMTVEMNGEPVELHLLLPHQPLMLFRKQQKVAVTFHQASADPNSRMQLPTQTDEMGRHHEEETKVVMDGERAEQAEERETLGDALTQGMDHHQEILAMMPGDRPPEILVEEKTRVVHAEMTGMTDMEEDEMEEEVTGDVMQKEEATGDVVEVISTGSDEMIKDLTVGMTVNRNAGMSVVGRGQHGEAEDRLVETAGEGVKVVEQADRKVENLRVDPGKPHGHVHRREIEMMDLAVAMEVLGSDSISRLDETWRIQTNKEANQQTNKLRNRQKCQTSKQTIQHADNSLQAYCVIIFLTCNLPSKAIFDF